MSASPTSPTGASPRSPRCRRAARSCPRPPDRRLPALAEMSKSRKVVPATVEFVDIAGLVAGSASGEGLGNRFLAGIREVDALCLVLRAFEDDEVPGDSD